MLSSTSGQSKSQTPSSSSVALNQKFSDLEKVVRILSEIDLTPLWEEKVLSAEESDLLSAVGECLLRLCEWVAVSDSQITLEAIQENAARVCRRYPQEVHFWADENCDTIGNLLARIEREHSHPTRKDHRVPASMPVVAPQVNARFVPTLYEEDARLQARLLKALADPTRLRILSLLRLHEGDVCVFEIVEAFTLEQPTISHHLRILREAGLVSCRKKGLWTYYYIRRETLGCAHDVIEDLA